MEALRAELAALGARSAWAAEWETGMHARLAAAHAAVVRALDRSEPECIAADLHESVAALEPMDATRVPEEVLDRVFSGFCIGK
jgi:tRNA U34 5-carboxymethylaminomethyl modifying GTPase MnmE/TrmE